MTYPEISRSAGPAAAPAAGASAGGGADPHAHAHAFAAVMEGFGPAATVPYQASSPSMASQLIRVPAQAYSAGMADIQAPPPQGMTVVQSLDFYAQQQIKINELRTMANMANIVVRMARKDLETVLNSK